MAKDKFTGKGPKAQAKPKKEAPTRKRKMLPEGVKGIVRMAEADLDGTKNLKSALPKIRGVGTPLAFAIIRSLGFDPQTITGTLTDEQISRLEEAVKDPAKFGIPSHMLDRRKDPDEGIDKHIVSSTLTITKKFDIDKMKKIRCYKGVRHEIGLPVRGQRTRGSFRTGMRVGVSRVKVKEAKKPAAAAPAAEKGAAPTKEAKKPEAKKEEKK